MTLRRAWAQCSISAVMACRRELGRLAAREAIAFGDDPPVQRWLGGQQLGVELRFAAQGPIAELRGRPKPSG